MGNQPNATVHDLIHAAACGFGMMLSVEIFLVGMVDGVGRR